MDSLCWTCKKSSCSDLCRWVGHFIPPSGAVLNKNRIVACPFYDAENCDFKKSNKPAKKITKSCAFCGREFTTSLSYQRYCSYKCRNKGAAAGMQVARKTKNMYKIKKCVVCGKEFPAYGRALYCSQECSEQRRKERQCRKRV